MQNYKNLKVWQKGHMLVKEIYRLTGNFPVKETYGLTSQIRRACVSIPNNIAEGAGRITKRDIARFYHVAFGSANEVEYLLFLSFELDLLKESDHIKLANDVAEVKKMLIGLLRSMGEKIGHFDH